MKFRKKDMINHEAFAERLANETWHTRNTHKMARYQRRIDAVLEKAINAYRPGAPLATDYWRLLAVVAAEQSRRHDMEPLFEIVITVEAGRSLRRYSLEDLIDANNRANFGWGGDYNTMDYDGSILSINRSGDWIYSEKTTKTGGKEEAYPYLLDDATFEISVAMDDPEGFNEDLRYFVESFDQET